MTPTMCNLCDHCKFEDIAAFSLPGALALPGGASALVAAIDAAIDADVTLPARFRNLLALALQPQLRSQLVNALTQLTGEVHTGAEQASFQAMNAFLRLMPDPFAETRGAGAASSAIGFAPERSAAFPPEVALAYASVLKERAAPPQLAAIDRPWNVWASGYGGRTNIGGDPNRIDRNDTSVRDYGYAAGPPTRRWASRSEFGAWFDNTVVVASNYAATLFARAAWAHDWGNDRALNTNFLTLPTPAFVINGADPPPDKALVSAGSELRLRNGWSLTGKFDGEFANRLQTYAGTGTVRYTW